MTCILRSLREYLAILAEVSEEEAARQEWLWADLAFTSTRRLNFGLFSSFHERPCTNVWLRFDLNKFFIQRVKEFHVIRIRNINYSIQIQNLLFSDSTKAYYNIKNNRTFTNGR